MVKNNKKSYDRILKIESDNIFIEKLKKLLGERLSLSDSIREHHGHDESFHESASPDAVAFVESNEEVKAILFDINGREVRSFKFTRFTTLHLSNLDKGTYFLNFKTNKG